MSSHVELIEPESTKRFQDRIRSSNIFRVVETLNNEIPAQYKIKEQTPDYTEIIRRDGDLKKFRYKMMTEKEFMYEYNRKFVDNDVHCSGDVDSNLILVYWENIDYYNEILEYFFGVGKKTVRTPKGYYKDVCEGLSTH